MRQEKQYIVQVQESAIAVSYQPEQTCKGLILLNDEYHGFSLSQNPSNNYKDLYSVAIHELGHVLGLCHSNNSQTVMYFDYQDNKRILHSYDIQGIEAIYDKVIVKNEFKNPNGLVSNGGIINVELNDYNTDNLPNQQKAFAFNKNSSRRFDAKEQTLQGIDRKFNSYIEYGGGWRRGSTIIGTTAVVNTDVITGSYKAPYCFKTNITISGQTEFDGVQALGSQQIWQYENGPISAPSQLPPINGRTYNFAGWTDGNGDNPRTITPDNNQTYNALYKMPQRSNMGAYGNNSQRKIVRSDDGKLHMVYESMGYVWYERSTNGGTTWQIMNGGKPIDSNPGKAPSIDILYQPENYQSEIYIVYQTYTSTTNDVAAIKAAYFLETQLQYINTVYVDDYYYRDYTSVNFNPVAAKMLAGRIMVAWEDNNIYYKIGNQITGGFSWGSTTSAGNSSGTEKFPTIAAYKVLPNGVFHLAWQDNYSTIYYRSYTLQQDGTFSISSITNVSQGCGYPTNYAPNINVSSSNQVYLVWIGSPYYGSSTRKTISRLKTTSWSSSFGQYGDKVLSPAAAFGGSNSIIAWSENPSGTTYSNKFLKYGSVKTAGTTGKDIQIFNADNLTNMFISSFNSNSLPY